MTYEMHWFCMVRLAENEERGWTAAPFRQRQVGVASGDRSTLASWVGTTEAEIVPVVRRLKSFVRKRIAALYRVEADICGLSPAERLAQPQARSRMPRRSG
jgi:hypothetical protein